MYIWDQRCPLLTKCKASHSLFSIIHLLVFSGSTLPGKQVVFCQRFETSTEGEGRDPSTTNEDIITVSIHPVYNISPSGGGGGGVGVLPPH